MRRKEERARKYGYGRNRAQTAAGSFPFFILPVRSGSRIRSGKHPRGKEPWGGPGTVTIRQSVSPSVSEPASGEMLRPVAAHPPTFLAVLFHLVGSCCVLTFFSIIHSFTCPSASNQYCDGIVKSKASKAKSKHRRMTHPPSRCSEIYRHVSAR